MLDIEGKRNEDSFDLQETDLKEYEETDLDVAQETGFADQPEEETEKPGREAPGVNDPITTYLREIGGVALLSREPAAEVIRGIPDGEEDDQARLIAGRFGDLFLVNVYVPNGTAVGSAQFAYKLRWLERLRQWLAGGELLHRPLIVCGDFNIGPQDAEYRALFAPPLVDAWAHARPGEPHPPTTGLFDRKQWPMGGHCRDYFADTPDVAARIARVECETASDASDHQAMRLALR